MSVIQKMGRRLNDFLLIFALTVLKHLNPLLFKELLFSLFKDLSPKDLDTEEYSEWVDWEDDYSLDDNSTLLEDPLKKKFPGDDLTLPKDNSTSEPKKPEFFKDRKRKKLWEKITGQPPKSDFVTEPYSFPQDVLLTYSKKEAEISRQAQRTYGYLAEGLHAGRKISRKLLIKNNSVALISSVFGQKDISTIYAISSA